MIRLEINGYILTIANFEECEKLGHPDPDKDHIRLFGGLYILEFLNNGDAFKILGLDVYDTAVPIDLCRGHIVDKETHQLKEVYTKTPSEWILVNDSNKQPQMYYIGNLDYQLARVIIPKLVEGESIRVEDVLNGTWRPKSK